MLEITITKMIRKGVLLRAKNITDPEAIATKENLWLILAVVNDAACLQAQNEIMDKFGNVLPVFWMRRSELEGNPNLEVVNQDVESSI